MKNQYITFLMVSWLVIAVCWTVVFSQPEFAHFVTYNGMRIKHEFVYVEHKPVSTIQCAFLCAVNKSCLSASFSNESGMCWMSANLIDGSENQHRLEVDASWTSLYKQQAKQGDYMLDWVEVNGTYYHFSVERLDYTDAQNYCEDRGVKMAEPQTEEKFELLGNYLIGKFGAVNFWFGLAKLGDDASAVWISNGETSSYTSWVNQSPPTFIVNHCVCLSNWWGSQYIWLDRYCYEDYYVICEK